jgi:carbon-monoxide dehydrogenase large subunit
MSIGQSLRRFEDERLLRGEGRFIDDLSVAGCLEAVFVRSTIAHGALRGVDAAAARAMPGVTAVLTGRDLEAAGVRTMKCRTALASSDGRPFNEPARPVLAVNHVRFAGEAVAIVVAEARACALDAAEQVVVTVEDLPPVVSIGRATERAFIWEHGDRAATDAAIAKAPLVSRLSAANNRVAPAPIEPRSAIASYDPATESFVLTTQTQGVHLIRNALAQILDIDPSHLRVQTFDVGGSFGLKLIPHPELAALLAAARVVGRPVRWTSTRSEAFLSDNHARDHASEATLALDADGRFLALDVATTCNLGAYASASAPACMAIHFMRTLGHVYRIPVHHLTATGVYTNTAPTDVMRGAGKPEAHALVERLVERAAREHGFDRVELRRRNLIQPEELPRKTLSGHLIDGGDFPRTLSLALETADWGGFPARREVSTADGRRRGIGLALYMHVSSHPTEERARVALEADGRIAACMGAQSIGQGHETTFAQLVAAELGQPLEIIRVVQGDTEHLPPFGAATGGSGSLQTSGAAVLGAARVLRERLTRRAADLLEAAAEDLRLESGGFRIIGTDRFLSLQKLSANMSAEERDGCAGTADRKGDLASCPNGAYVAEVEIDPETGKTTVVRFSGADDAGRRLNPMIVEGQLHGGLAQGIGQALYERVVYDESSGQLVTGSLMDYVLPLAGDLPRFDLVAADVPSTVHELGVKGVGECGTIGAPAAIMNAIADAIGHDRIEMPATPERVWQTLREEGSGQ